MSTITSAKGKDGRPFQDSPVVDRAKEMASAAADKAGAVVDQAGALASAALEKAGSVATVVTQKADQLAATAGSNIKTFGETIQQKGPKEGMLGDATKTVGGTIEAGGKYIEEQGVTGMIDDAAELIKRNPVPAILVGVGVGVLIGWALRR